MKYRHNKWSGVRIRYIQGSQLDKLLSVGQSVPVLVYFPLTHSHSLRVANLLCSRRSASRTPTRALIRLQFSNWNINWHPFLSNLRRNAAAAGATPADGLTELWAYSALQKSRHQAVLENSHSTTVLEFELLCCSQVFFPCDLRQWVGGWGWLPQLFSFKSFFTILWKVENITVQVAIIN